VEVILLDIKNQKRSGEIKIAEAAELKNLKAWNFDWFKVSKQKKSKVYKMGTDRIEGLMMIKFVENDFFEMRNIEVSPLNYGSKGNYTNVAQLLIAYGCLLSFELNKGPYEGYLSFISKGELIDYYIEKYNAELAYRDRMYINPENSLKLIEEHLNVKL